MLEESTADELIMRLAYDQVKRVSDDRYIVELSGKYGLIALNQEFIIPCEYSEMVQIGMLVRAFVNNHKITGAEDNTIFDINGREILPISEYEMVSVIDGFGMALYNRWKNTTFILSDNGNVKKILGKTKLTNIGMDGYAGEDYSGRILGMELTLHDNLNHLYDKLEKINNNLFKATKANRYTFVNRLGIQTSDEWLIDCTL